MIILYAFGPAFGLPDPSPFVMKAEVLLKLAGLEYRTDQRGFRNAPKGKLPYIDDEGQKIADSTFIRWHIEKKYGHDLDRGLGKAERAIAWAFEKMLEDNFYWILIAERWDIDENFRKGPASFFKAVPAPLRPFVTTMVRRQVRKSAHAHGMGRHTREEMAQLASRSLQSVSDYLADKPFFMGTAPTGVDATVFAFVASALCPIFDSPVQTAADRCDNLRRYVGRMTARFYPEFKEIAGCKAAA